jgi:hypothetical protein
MTETYATLSDFTPIESPGTHPVPMNGTLSPIRSDFARPPELVIFSDVPADGTKERADQISRMEERMKPKDEFPFAPAIDGRLKVHTPFRVHIVPSFEGVSAHAVEIDEFGHGANRGEALDDLGKTIAELYFSLASERDRLSPDLAGVLKALEGHVAQVHS